MMDFSLYKQLAGQIKKSCIIPHYLHPNHNLASCRILGLISKDFNDEFPIIHDRIEFLSEIPCFKTFKYKVQYCYPIYFGSQDVDTAMKIVKKKLIWERKLNTFNLVNNKGAIRIIKELQKNNTPHLPKKLFNYLEHMRKDPEPAFNGSYNWMYTGGNLAHLQVNNDVILLGSDSNSTMSFFNVLKLNKNSGKYIFQGKFKMKKNYPILQLCAKSKQDGLLIIVRQKNSMCLVGINDSDQSYIINGLWKKKVAPKKLLTSIDISEGCQKVLSSDSSGDINVHNVESGMKVYGYSLTTSVKDNWNQVLAAEDLIYAANRSALCFLDPRENDFSNPVFIYNPSDAVHLCENICSMTRSLLDSNYVYLGTSHHLIQVDIRTGDHVQKWTHLMKYPPQFLECILLDGKDFLILQSCQSSETVGIINGPANDDEDSLFLHSNHLPRALTNAKYSLKLAKMKGLCLSPHTSKRFDYHVTGIRVLKEDEGDDLVLLTINSGGDIFRSRISKRQKNEDDSLLTDFNFIEQMKKYDNSHMKKLWSTKEKKMRVPKIECMRNIKTDLENVSVAYKRVKRKIRWRCSEMFEEESLVMYQDMMAEKVLKVWGIETVKSVVNSTVSVTEKVRNWMAANDMEE